MAVVALQALREQIRKLEGGPQVLRQRVPTGVSEVDALVGGLPTPGVLEIHGQLGGGRSTLAAQLAARQTQSGRAVAWVDPERRLYPPALEALGVVLPRLLIVRPPEDGSSPWIWAVEQLLRSGCFPMVVADLPPRTGSRKAASHQWARASELGQCTAVVLSDRPTRELPAEVRLASGRGRLTIVRDRQGTAGKSVPFAAEAPHR